MALKLTFEIELASDYHVSAGHGLGLAVDSALQRDVDGVPVLRGTTVVGLLRDGLYRLLQLAPLVDYLRCQAAGVKDTDAPAYCGAKDPDAPDCPVCQLFGSPRTPKRWRIGSARPRALTEIQTLKERWAPGEVAAQIAPHVRVSPRTRRAEARKLFFREEGDARLTFTFDAVCDVEDAQALEEAAWLVAAARFVRNLGAGRRRGRGACAFRLVAATAADGLGDRLPDDGVQDWFLDKFEGYHLLRTESPPAVTRPAFEVGDVEDKAAPVRKLVIARLEEPLLISEKAEAGNEFQTLDYIPGTSLRGAFAGRAAARYDLEGDAMAYDAFVTLFFHAGARFSPLYPAERVGRVLHPAVPAPQSLLTCKLYPGFRGADDDPAHGALNYAHRDGPEDLLPKCEICEAPLKPFRGYLPLREDSAPLESRHVTEMHVHIHPDTRKAAEGDLFGFDALQPGQYLLGELVFADAPAWRDFQALCDVPTGERIRQVTLRLGKANRRGYGRVILWLQDWDKEVDLWQVVPFEKRVTDPAEPLTLTLLSNTILPDPWGRFHLGIDEAWLNDWLGQIPDDQNTSLGVGAWLRRSFCTSRPVSAFNAHFGLPRWRDVAIRAGSTVGFELTGVPPGQRQRVLDWLKAQEAQGIGLRRDEGFGRIVFNHSLCAGGQGLEDAAVFLETDPMRLAQGGNRHGLRKEAKFVRDWETHLAEAPALQSDGALAQKELAGLARLLQAQRPTSVAEVKKILDHYGDSAQLLPAEALKRLGAREADKQGRRYPESSQGQRARKALDGSDGLLSTLEQRVAQCPQEARQRCWRLGFAKLADHIAAVADTDREDEA